MEAHLKITCCWTYCSWNNHACSRRLFSCSHRNLNIQTKNGRKDRFLIEMSSDWVSDKYMSWTCCSYFARSSLKNRMRRWHTARRSVNTCWLPWESLREGCSRVVRSCNFQNRAVPDGRWRPQLFSQYALLQPRPHGSTVQDASSRRSEVDNGFSGQRLHTSF
jgi:hypothetical protein